MSSHRSKAMSWVPILYIAWKNIMSRKLRTLLTVGGVVIGLGSIFFLLSLGLGLQNLVTHQVIGNQSVKTVDVTSANSDIVKLNSDSLQKIRHLPNVDKIGGLYAGSGKISLDGSEVDSVVFGVDAGYYGVSQVDIEAGRLIDRSKPQEVVVNTAALKAMGVTEYKTAIDKQLKITLEDAIDSDPSKSKTHDSIVIGVIESGTGSEIYFSDSVFTGNNADQYKQVKLLATNVDAVPDLRKRIESVGLETSSPLDTIAQIQELFKYLNTILVGIGSIGMIVAILGMFNTLTISLLERTREIGLMIAVGLRNRDIRRMLIVESLLLSLIGSIVGVVLAIFAGGVLDVFMNNIAHTRGFDEKFSIFHVPLWLPFAVTLFMMLVGVVVSYFPARRAGRINPIDALRDE